MCASCLEFSFKQSFRGTHQAEFGQAALLAEVVDDGVGLLDGADEEDWGQGIWLTGDARLIP